ncbi:MAG TPA: DUF2723 domain-containing protein, partial [Firmicutes bacterium]|nr:DUF2723 domain-containing protein [Bacillota bacterium]
LIGYVFAHIPIGDDIAFRLNLMSAFFALLTVFVLYLIIYHFTRTPYLSFSISLAYAFSPIFWSQAVVAEVYTLNTFLTALSLYFLCRWVEKRRDGWLYLAAVTMGLATTNHQLSLLLLPTTIYMLWLFSKGLKRPKNFWFKLAGLYLLGTLVYLYLPIRAAADPPLNWGNPDNLERFITAVFNPAGSQVSQGSRWLHFFHALYLWTVQFSPVIMLDGMKIPILIIWFFGIWGIYKGLSTGWRMARVFVVFMLLNLFTILWVSRPKGQELMIVGVYYLPVFLVFAVFMATGIREWLQHIQNLFKESGKTFLSVLLVLIIIILVLIPEYQYFQNRRDADRSNDYYARDYGTMLLDSCPPDTILIMNWDDIFTIWYLQKVEEHRTDVIPVIADFPVGSGEFFWGSWYFDELEQTYPEIFKGTGSPSGIFESKEDAINAFAVANRNRGNEVFFTFYGLGYDFKKFDFMVFPLGPVYRAGNTLPDLKQSKLEWEKTISSFRNIFSYYDNRIIEEDFIISRMSGNLLNNAKTALNFVREMNISNIPVASEAVKIYTDHAIWFLEHAIRVDPGNIPATIELVNIYIEQGKFDDCIDILSDARMIDPGNPDIYIYL